MLQSANSFHVTVVCGPPLPINITVQDLSSHCPPPMKILLCLGPPLPINIIVQNLSSHCPPVPVMKILSSRNNCPPVLSSSTIHNQWLMVKARATLMPSTWMQSVYGHMISTHVISRWGFRNVSKLATCMAKSGCPLYSRSISAQNS